MSGQELAPPTGSRSGSWPPPGSAGSQVPVVAVAGCRPAPDRPADDLYPDPDSDLLVERLLAKDCDARLVAWDDPDVDWADCDLVVVRSTWDSVDRPGDYLSWVRHVDECTAIQNPASIIEWNLDKVYLRDLAERGVPTIPTQWVFPGDGWTVPGDEFIVKPAVGSGARNIARYSAAGVAGARDHVSMLGDGGQTVLVQDYLSSIETAGETSIVFIGGRLSHAIRKGGFLNLDEGVLERPWERMTYLGPCDATPLELQVAETTFRLVADRTTEPISYGRVDLVPGPGGRPVVIEVELIDPVLSLVAYPGSADALAATLGRLLA